MPPTTVAIRSLQGPGVRGERVGDLLGQLPGGDEDQGQRPAGVGALPGGAGQQREAEGERLARSGAAAAQDVPSGERVRQGGRLDRERHGHALGDQRRQEGRGHVQVGEGLGGREGGGDGHRQGELTLDGGGAAAVATTGALRPAGAALRTRGPLTAGCRAAESVGSTAAGGSAGTRPGKSVVRARCAIAVHGEPSLEWHVSRNSFRAASAMYGAKNRKNEPVKYRKTKPVQRMNQPESALHMTADNRRTRLVHTGNYSVGATA